MKLLDILESESKPFWSRKRTSQKMEIKYYKVVITYDTMNDMPDIAKNDGMYRCVIHLFLKKSDDMLIQTMRDYNFIFYCNDKPKMIDEIKVVMDLIKDELSIDKMKSIIGTHTHFMGYRYNNGFKYWDHNPYMKT